MSYYIYIVRCEDGTLYTGITTDPRRRMREHVLHRKAGAKYTKSHQVLSLEALWSAESRSEALIDAPSALADFLPPHIDAAAYQTEETFSLDVFRHAQADAGISPCEQVDPFK